VASKEFCDQFLDVRGGRVYCIGCCMFIPHRNSKHVRQHCFGTQNVKEALKILEMVQAGEVPEHPLHLQKCVIVKGSKARQKKSLFFVWQYKIFYFNVGLYFSVFFFFKM